MNIGLLVLSHRPVPVFDIAAAFGRESLRVPKSPVLNSLLLAHHRHVH